MKILAPTASAILRISVPALLCLTPRPATGQTDAQLSMGLSAAYVDLRAQDVDETLGGFLFGVEAGASASRFYLRGEYRNGRLGPGSDGGSGRRVTSARAGLGVRLLPWFMVEGGPWISRIELPGEDRNVIRWRVGIVARAPLVRDLVSGYASATGSFAGTGIGLVEIPDGGGGELGLVVEPTDRLWARLGYRFDREYLPLGSSRTSEAVFLTLGVSVPRLQSDG